MFTKRAVLFTATLLTTSAALAFDGAFTDAVVRSGVSEVQACGGRSGDGGIECVASALQSTGTMLSSRPDYVPAARVFLDASARVRSTLGSATPPKEKVKIVRAALDDVRKTLLSTSGPGKAEFSKLTRVPETAKGVLKA